MNSTAPSWDDVTRCTAQALACGALHSFDTVESVIEDIGMRFLVRQAAALARKEVATRSTPSRDPFSPCEAALRVGDIGSTHFLLLNKFNVLEHHMLIVTNEFEPQDSLIDEDDFRALLACFDRFDALGFYNGGAIAGSSQPHKHMQMVPLISGVHAFPVDTAVHAARRDGLFRVPQFGFPHAAVWLGHTAPHDARRILDLYRRLLQAIGVTTRHIDGREHHASPYNLLVTRRWMLAVPRAASHVEGIAINALGFAGSLFVRDDAQRLIVQTVGPMALLARAAHGPAHAT
jgi:sulfate adenylyltransferase (ADP) / ATP adenylyltransferase